MNTRHTRGSMECSWKSGSLYTNNKLHWTRLGKVKLYWNKLGLVRSVCLDVATSGVLISFPFSMPFRCLSSSGLVSASFYQRCMTFRGRYLQYLKLCRRPVVRGRVSYDIHIMLVFAVIVTFSRARRDYRRNDRLEIAIALVFALSGSLCRLLDYWRRLRV